MKKLIILVALMFVGCSHMSKAGFGVMTDGRVFALEPRIGRLGFLFEVDSVKYPKVRMQILRETAIESRKQYFRLKKIQDSIWVNHERFE